MKIILQRVLHSSIVVNGAEPKTISKGLVALAGFAADDTKETVDFMLNKMINLRIFDDEDGNLNLSLEDTNGEIMLVSNFTLYANCKKGRRPAFVNAARPEAAVPLYDYMVEEIKNTQIPLVTGEFGADMQITLCNDGPVTIDLDSDEIMPQKKG